MLSHNAAGALQVECEAVAAADVLGAAKGLLVSQPEGLLQRLVLQVMQLLGVERLEGLPAAVNRVSEAHTGGTCVLFRLAVGEQNTRLFTRGAVNRHQAHGSRKR